MNYNCSILFFVSRSASCTPHLNQMEFPDILLLCVLQYMCERATPFMCGSGFGCMYNALWYTLWYLLYSVYSSQSSTFSYCFISQSLFQFYILVFSQSTQLIYCILVLYISHLSYSIQLSSVYKVVAICLQYIFRYTAYIYLCNIS